ncbi:MAG: hypothetical protein ACFFFC_19260 [Candidatus Thorarchaeota archaeon]
MRHLNSITPRQLCTLWWSTRWVRYLVLSLIPVGVIDAAYTLLTTWELGVEIEFNPVTRFFLYSDLWLAWAIMNVFGFAIFSMMTGSYYLHTRSNPEGPDTSLFSLIIAFRVAVATYNITYYYIPFIVAVYPPFWTSIFMFALTYFGIGRVLNRRTDISQQGIIQYFRNRINNIKDRRLISTAGRHSSDSQTAAPAETQRKSEGTLASIEELPTQRRSWSKRIGYLTLASLAMVSMLWMLDIVGVVTGLYTFRDQYPIVFINTLVGRGLVATLIVVLSFIAISMYMIIKAFDTHQ